MKHPTRNSLLLGTIALGITAVPAFVQEKGGEGETGPYDVVANWPGSLDHPGWTWGSQSGVFAETPDRVFILSRGEVPEKKPVPGGATSVYPPGTPQYSLFQLPRMPVAATGTEPRMTNCINILNSTGKVIESWTQWDHLFAGGRGPHKVKINPYDPEKHVWIMDDERQQIFKFTHDGKQLVLTLGEAGVKGDDDKHFGRPTDIAWMPEGTFFISDGYVNTRVVKFDKNGKYLMTWGTRGKGPGEFNLPHSIDIDANRRVYVADRSNSRVQIFDENGKYLDEWDHIRSPYHIMITNDQHLWVADGATNQMVKYDLNGKYLYSWGTYGSYPGGFWGVHEFSVDTDGNLYTAEVFAGRQQKFRPKKDADRAKLIAPPLQSITALR
jgi:hypothetical protein